MLLLGFLIMVDIFIIISPQSENSLSGYISKTKSTNQLDFFLVIE